MTERISYHEAFELLVQKAREGSVSAVIHLEKVLRAQKAEQNEVDDAIDAILARTQAGEGRG
jgi:hypothetical protein